MDNPAKCLLQKVVRRIPNPKLNAMLEKWGRLTSEQQQSLDFTQSTRELTENLLDLCEESGLSVRHIAGLEMIYVMDSPDKRKWHAFHLQNPGDDAVSVELAQFKVEFKAHLTEITRHVSLKVKKHTDDAIWLRIAWADKSSRPNHLNATYIVHYLQTPYAFMTSLTSQQKPIVYQALCLATRYSSVKDANLTGMSLTAIKDLLMRKYQQVFPAMHPSPFETRKCLDKNQQVVAEQSADAEKRDKMACEAFGYQELPQLQTVVYKLETKFRDDKHNIVTKKEESIRCTVKFSSANVLESLRHCAKKGIASTPVSPLLSYITQQGRNHFTITDGSAQRPGSQDGDRTNP